MPQTMDHGKTEISERSAGGNQRRKIALPERCEKRLLAYTVAGRTSCTLAAAAASVGMLTLTQPLEADIIYTPSSEALSFRGIYGAHYQFSSIDLNHDGRPDFQFWMNSAAVPDGEFANLAVRGFSGAGIVGAVSASVLPAGATIGAGRAFAGSARMAYFVTNFYFPSGNGIGGKWANASGYLGLRFDVDRQTHFGWAQLNVQASASEGGGNVLGEAVSGFAYETVANQPIEAGQTQELAPEPCTLGLLALGSLGLGFWRRRKVVGGRP
jgi:hypothetical protein